MDRASFVKVVVAAPAAASRPHGSAAPQTPGPPGVPPSMRVPGGPIPSYGRPSSFEARVVREPPDATMVAFTPLGEQAGPITPNGLFFTRNHAGVARIDPRAHRLLVHGRVRRPLVFSMADLLRLPSVSRAYFIECSGNTEIEWQGPQATSVARSHGLASCSEWTGVPLRIVLDAVGATDDARYVLAEGADGAGYDRSFPIEKARDDALLAYAQNGERLRPEQGFPLRLILPGWEGNTCVKWLRRLELGPAPFGEREALQYAELYRDGISRVDDFVMRAKSVVTYPSVGDRLGAFGAYELRGLAWSGRGKIAKVEITLDGGDTWADAALDGPVLEKAFTRFTFPLAWAGASSRIASRATDETGYVQPTHRALVAERGIFSQYHNNAIQFWTIATDGKVSNAAPHA